MEWLATGWKAVIRFKAGTSLDVLHHCAQSVSVACVKVSADLIED
jgi:hypothetical protein